MNHPTAPAKVLFRLPPKHALQPNGPDDPLPYYYHPLVGPLYRRRVAQALALLKPPYESILELGYGSGILLPSLSAIGAAVHGIDIESDPAKVSSNLARLGVHVQLARGDIRHTSYADQSFDLIVAISVFEHLHELESVADEAFRLLKPSGQLLVGMPRVDRLMERLFPLIGYYNIRSHHVANYRQLLEAARSRFDLVRLTTMPRLLPKSAGLYFNMLFRKASPPSPQPHRCNATPAR